MSYNNNTPIVEHIITTYKFLQILYDGTFSKPHFSNSVFE